MTSTTIASTEEPQLQSTSGVFGALLLRDLAVLRTNLGGFLSRTLLQPLLLVFVFTYVFPKIGQGVGGADAATATFTNVIIAGVVANAILFQGILSVTLPLVHDFGQTKEIEDRVLAPTPVGLVAVEKIVAGAFESLLAGLIVFPMAAFVPATPVDLSISWPVLVTMVPLACLMSGALGLLLGTFFKPQTVPVLFGVILVPVTFLGAMYYTWLDLASIRWLQVASLINPLVYLSEGFRAAMTPVRHMSLAAVYPIVVGLTAILAWQGIRRFTRRVVG